MKKTLFFGAAAFVAAAVAVSPASYAAQCMENGVVVSCPPDAKLAIQQQAAAPAGARTPLELDPNQFRASEVDPGRYPGPSIYNENGPDAGNE